MRTFGYAVLAGIITLALSMVMAIASNLSGDGGWLGRDFAFAASAFIFMVIVALLMGLMLASQRQWRLLGAFVLVMLPMIVIGTMITPPVGRAVAAWQNTRIGQWNQQPLPASFLGELQQLEPSLPPPAVRKLSYRVHPQPNTTWVVELSFPADAILALPPSRIAGIARLTRAADRGADEVVIIARPEGSGERTIQIATFTSAVRESCTTTDAAAIPCARSWNKTYLARHNLSSRTRGPGLAG